MGCSTEDENADAHHGVDEVLEGSFACSSTHNSQLMKTFIAACSSQSAIPKHLYARLRFSVQNFAGIGLLRFFRRPVWRTVGNGSRAYVDKLVTPFRDRIRTGAPV